MSVWRLGALAGLALVASGVVVACKKKSPPPSIQRVPESVAFTNAKATTVVRGPLRVVATREGDVTVGTLSDGRVYAMAGLAFAIATDDGGFEHDPHFMAGLAPYNELGGYGSDQMSLGGRFPDDLWMTQTMLIKRAGETFLIAGWDGAAWKPQPRDGAPLRPLYQAFGPWKDDRTIALRLNTLPFGSADEKRMKEAIAASRPRLEVVGTASATSAPPSFAANTWPSAFASLASGEIMALLGEPHEGTGFRAEKVQRWPAAGGDGVVETLPGMQVSARFVTMSSNESAWVGGVEFDRTLYLAHFDGAAWTKVTPPVKYGHFLSMAEAPDGTLWLATEWTTDEPCGALWQKARTASGFERVALPTMRYPELGNDHLSLAGSGTPTWTMVAGDPAAAAQEWSLSPQQVAISSAGEPIVVAYAVDGNAGSAKADARTVVLRPRAVTKPVVLPSRELIEVEREEQAPDATITAISQNGVRDTVAVYFVLVGDVPEGAPDDYDPKELRAALKQMAGPITDTIQIGDETRVIEVRLRGKRRFGIYVPFCYSEACLKSVDRLVAALASKLPGAAPKLYRRIPHAVRDLKMTFAR